MKEQLCISPSFVAKKNNQNARFFRLFTQLSLMARLLLPDSRRPAVLIRGKFVTWEDDRALDME